LPIGAPIIAALITAATAATTTGLELAGAGQPSTPKQATTPAQTGPTVDQAKAAIAPQALSIESATGGSVSPDYLSTIAPLAAGVGGQPNTNNAMQQLLQQIFGKGGGGSTTGSTGAGAGTAPFTPSGLPVNLAALSNTPGASDFLSKISGGLT
jgi:hypothetical protein